MVYMVWCGMVWCGMVCVWYGIVLCAVVQYSYYCTSSCLSFHVSSQSAESIRLWTIQGPGEYLRRGFGQSKRTSQSYKRNNPYHFLAKHHCSRLCGHRVSSRLHM